MLIQALACLGSHIPTSTGFAARARQEQQQPLQQMTILGDATMAITQVAAMFGCLPHKNTQHKLLLSPALYSSQPYYPWPWEQQKILFTARCQLQNIDGTSRQPSASKLTPRVPALRAAAPCHQHILQQVAACYLRVHSYTNHSALCRS